MEKTKLQELYWQSQILHDKLFALEHKMRKIVATGKACVSIQAKYYELLDELREINAEIIMIDA